MVLANERLGMSVGLAPSRITIGVSGELDLVTSPGLHEKATRAMRPDLSLIVDLAEVTFIDSAGVETLRSLAELVRDGGGEFHLRRPSGDVARLLEDTGLTDAAGLAAPPQLRDTVLDAAKDIP